ncbi:hypothetical protein PPGU19_049830 [Paraburkholderia sp. PGU19]|nr:hypothetical protein PPGU19_049830 [Paraburkholderia sp. PGU19]
MDFRLNTANDCIAVDQRHDVVNQTGQIKPLNFNFSLSNQCPDPPYDFTRTTVIGDDVLQGFTNFSKIDGRAFDEVLHCLYVTQYRRKRLIQFVCERPCHFAQ